MKGAFLVAIIATTLFAAATSSPPSGRNCFAIKKEIKAVQPMCTCPIVELGSYSTLGISNAVMVLKDGAYVDVNSIAWEKPRTAGNDGRTIRRRENEKQSRYWEIHIDPGLI